LFFFHICFSDGSRNTDNFLKLEFNSTLEFHDSFLHVVTSFERNWEFSHLNENLSHLLSNKFHHFFGAENDFIRLDPVFDISFILFESLDLFLTDGVNTKTSGSIHIIDITNHDSLVNKFYALFEITFKFGYGALSRMTDPLNLTSFFGL